MLRCATISQFGHLTAFFALLLLPFGPSLFAQTLAVDLPAEQLFCDGEEILLTPTVSGGDGNYSYEWATTDGGFSGPGDQQNLLAAGPGTYFLTVTDGTGATAEASTTVSTGQTALTAIEVAICEGETYDIQGVVLTVSGHYDFSIPGGAASGCDSIVQLTLNVLAGVEVDLGPDNTSCNLDPITLDATPSFGTPPYSYSWSTGETTATIEVQIDFSDTQIYSVVVTDGNGCSGTDVIALSSGTISVDATSTPATCGETNGQAMASVTGGSQGGFNFLWSNGANTPTIQDLAPGEYGVTVTNAYGCSAQTTVTVGAIDEIEAAFEVPDPGCPNQPRFFTPDGTGLGATFEWSFTGNPNVSAIPGQGVAAIWPAAGTYQATLTMTLGACQDEITQDIVINGTSPIDAGPENIDLCLGGAVTLGGDPTGPAGVAYQWLPAAGLDDPSSANPTASPAVTTVYTVAFMENGCWAVDTTTVNVFQALDLGFEATSPSDCAADDGSLTAVVAGDPELTYSWSTGETTPTITDLAVGTYHVTVTNAEGCTATASYELGAELLLTATIEATALSVCSGESVTLSALPEGGDGDYTYTWSTGETGQQIIVAPSSTTTYEVQITDGSGCSNQAAVEVTVAPPLEPTVTVIEPTCFGAVDGVISVIQVGGILNYAWSTGASTPVLQGLPAGDYCLTITNSLGCTFSECYTITEPAPLEVDVIQDSAPCPNQPASLSAGVTGGTAPYVYSWQLEGMVFGNTPTIMAPEAGLYTLTVIDANGCTLSAQAEISYDLEAATTAPIYFLGCPSGTVTLNGSLSTSGPDITYQWTGPGGFSSTAINPTVNEAGLYTLVVTDTGEPDCFAETTVEVIDPNARLSVPIELSTLACNSFILSVDQPDLPNVMASWTLPNGATVNDAFSLQPSMEGLYTLDLSAAGCTASQSYFVTFDEACANLNGLVLWDEDEDCVSQVGEQPHVGWLVRASSPGGTYHSFTNADGYYDFVLPLGDYELTVFPPSTAWESCVDLYNISLAAEGATVNQDIPVQRVAQCPQVSAHITTGFLRRCFTSTYYLTVCNDGAEPANFPEAVLTLDPFLTYTNATLAPAEVNGQFIRWELPTLEPGQCRSWQVTVQVSCDATLGQVHCSELLVTPDPLCVPVEAGWSGANLELVGGCEDEEVVFRLRNTGEGDLIETVNYIVIEDGVILMEQPGMLQGLPSAEEETFNFPANGATYTFQVDQADFHPFSETLTVSVEGCGTDGNGEFTTGIATQFPNTTATLASDVLCLENIGAYDPNDKNALPRGFGPEHYIEPETEIDYRIRFQNTGTDTAFTVVIRDTLSDWLDLTTFRRGSASHAYALDVAGERTLVFTFPNILLPDSTTNLEASQGFIDFSLRPREDTPLGTVIENSAAIYFDFNEPVITNTYFHTVDRNFLEITNWEVVAPGAELSWRVFPNPADAIIQLRLDGPLAGEKVIVISDQLGREVLRHRFAGDATALPVAELPAGWYSLRLRSVDGRLLGSGKLVKR